MDEERILPGAVEVELGQLRLIPGPKGDPGEAGPRGVGISSAVPNPDYTLTLNFEDGTSCTTPPLRGEDGVGVRNVRLEEGQYGGGEYTDEVVVELTDGKVFRFGLWNRAAEYGDRAEAAKEAAESARDRAVRAAAEAEAGVPGPQGPAGADGTSAYESAKSGGYGGTETQFYADLAGVAQKADKSYVDQAVRAAVLDSWEGSY